MDTGAIIYSRMLSQRFPKKALHNINNIPLLQHVVNRAKLIEPNITVVIATSTNKSDDAIEELAKDLKVDCFRGDHENVSKRTIGVIEKYKFNYLIRICGDRPLLDPSLYSLALKQLIKHRLDLCTSNYPKILPAGLTVEVFTSDSFIKIYSKKLNEYEKEHITSPYYKNQNGFKVMNIILPKGFYWINPEKTSYTVDRKEDVKFIEYNLRNTKETLFGFNYLKQLHDLSLTYSSKP